MNSDIYTKTKQMYITRMQGVVSNDVAEKRFESFTSGISSEPLARLVSRDLKTNGRVLDVGSGFGSFVLELKKRNIDAVGIEINSIQCDFSRMKLSSLDEKCDVDLENTFVNGSALNLPFADETFDVVTLWDVLEHIESFEDALKEVHRVLKVGGRIFIRNANYSMVFVEPHYQVLWLPCLNKKWGNLYLKFRGKNTSYFSESIFLIKNKQVVRSLIGLGFKLTTDRIEKLNKDQSVIDSIVKRMLHRVIGLLGLKPSLIFIMKFFLKTSFVKYTDIIAIK